MNSGTAAAGLALREWQASDTLASCAGEVLIGSLFTGYGGLDMAVQAVFGGRVAWVADNDKDVAALLAWWWPGIPNLGDLEHVDWSQVPRVHILCGGFPCQDISPAGQRAGIKAGNRSGLWAIFLAAIVALRPRIVIIENSGGLTSARAERGAGSEVESCAWCVGDVSAEPDLRAFGRVLGDLASVGFDAEWVVVAASEVGAPHLRKRGFILAWDAAAAADADAGGRGPGVADVPAGQPDAGGGVAADADGDQQPREHPQRAGRDAAARGGAGVAADTDRGRGEARRAGAGEQRGADADHGGAVAVADTAVAGHGGRAHTGSGRGGAGEVAPPGGRRQAGGVEPERQGGGAAADTGGAGLQGPRRLDGQGRVGEPAGHFAADTVGGGRARRALVEGRGPVGRVAARRGGQDGGAERAAAADTSGARGRADTAGAPGVQAGPGAGDEPVGGGQVISWQIGDDDFEPAIRRWEHILGRACPPPTEPARGGTQRLGTRFDEWMMGLPEGHVTSVPGLPPSAKIRIIGNGVVPAQGEYALRLLVAALAEREAAA